jgi:glucose-1-phosphate adenylyltransferase
VSGSIVFGNRIVEARRFGVLEADAHGKAIGFQEKPAIPCALPGDPKKGLVSMGVYVFNTAVLLRALMENAAQLDSNYDFRKHVIPSSMGAVPVRVHELRDSAGAPG